MLVKYKANVNMQDNYGQIPFILAVERGCKNFADKQCYLFKNICR
ncbi:hypothetical protein CAXC1_150065 [Candidatus Xenohaliotis californiensis]|uniref:Ankyrin repeat protein n=1 Tax=Candidatus Xenohaliotis californiensis TaxID=84677 RepID=A0ABP0ET89_9RICK|nr:hypothetical protein CAXC1_150065 [Candidatus Xenohaliotis californiensis]